MSEKLIEQIKALNSYYDHHKIEKMIETHPGFIADDLNELLKELKKEMRLQNEL